MLAHYLAVALAKFAKSPFTTAANVLTLALGLACFIAAYGVASYWRSGDFYHSKAERTYVVGQSITPLGEARDGSLQVRSSALLAAGLREDFPELEQAARVFDFRDVAVAADENKAMLNVALTDAAFLQIFDFTFLAGDPAEALAAPGGVVITQETAARLFGDAPAMGRTLSFDGFWEGVVTGVIAPVRQPSFMGAREDSPLTFDVIAEWSASPMGQEYDARGQWTRADWFTFVALPPTMTVDAFNTRLAAFIDDRVPAAERAQADTSITAFPIRELTTRRLDNLLFAGGGANVTAVSVLIGLGVLTLMVACANYANLATAQAGARGKEAGMRKVMGAGPVHLMAQSWLEAGLLTAAAVAIALGLLGLVAPAIETAMGVDILFFLTRGFGAAAVLAVLFIAVTALAGAYPALIVARMRPLEAVQAGKERSGGGWVGRVLVGVQFASASFLLILLTVAQLQRAHLESAALERGGDPVVVLNSLTFTNITFDALDAALRAIPGVRSVSLTTAEPWIEGRSDMTLARSAEPGALSARGGSAFVGPDYFATMGVGVLAGEVFDRERHAALPRGLAQTDPSTPLPVVIDRAYAERLGFASPDDAVGEVIFIPEAFMRDPFEKPAQPVEIIGVTETETIGLSGASEAGALYVFRAGQHRVADTNPVVRIAPDNISTTLAAITELWDELAPARPANIQFVDQLFEESYREHARIKQLFLILAASAFVIASVGQLAIAVHAAQQRRHEIGVRKVLGASALNIARMLLIDFAKPALVANLVAWPLAYLAARIYLEAFADAVELTPAPFALSMAITLAIAWAAVIGEVLKAASVRPADVLRHA